MILAHLAVFALSAVLDFADTAHKLAVERRQAWHAAGWSVTMYLLGLVSLASVLSDPWLAVSACGGLAVGSVVAVRRAR
jgi:hypothetical protein